MGIVIDFPVRDVAFVSRRGTSLDQNAKVVILPVIRIERYDEQPTYRRPVKGNANRKRSRRVSGA